ncbi:hypothetical protein CKK33_07980 [Mucilaginibacter sp. MD40]|uniref:TlpA family protein disulfide reductase n=1 Tax=Mucilaginibacter sp. MD40 TaxID=2029590 RepID=UPI000BACD2DC|nr:TlpA disulfide reductase family protein [Mucilaginibacter sp. MD40]PAW93432.1 hypothetical protein CKK33_07980 [Mucilaginibacter sp. MD40]
MKKLSAIILMFILNRPLAVNAQIYGTKKAPLDSAPDIELLDINGKVVKLKELAKGKVLFIDNWFIPCPPCFIEMKMLHDLYAKYKGNKNFCFITISRTDRDIVKRFIAKDPLLKKYTDQYEYFSTLDHFSLPVYFSPGCNAKVQIEGEAVHWTETNDPAKCADNIFGFSGYPTVVVFNKQGKLIFNKTGYDGNNYAAMAEIENVLRPALAKN